MDAYHSLCIASVQKLTEDSICVGFAVPERLWARFKFVPGQYLTLSAKVGGEKISRSYSICSGAGDNQLRVAIKRVPNGAFSNHANNQFKTGDRLDVMPPRGKFCITPNPENNKNYMCIAVGSGITPILSIIKSVLGAEPKSRVTLIYGNRNTGAMMFREQLSFLKNAYLGRLQWINIMSREDQGSDLFQGRIDNSKGYWLQKRKLIHIPATDEAFICGPQSMMAEISHGFRNQGLADCQIHYELFASSAEDAQTAVAKAKHRVAQYGEKKTSRVTLVADGRSCQFALATVGENILDAGLHQGMELPYSCKAGVCSTCKARLVSGQVEMDITHGLEPREIADGLILACQAHPISEQLVIDFDQR